MALVIRLTVMLDPQNCFLFRYETGFSKNAVEELFCFERHLSIVEWSPVLEPSFILQWLYLTKMKLWLKSRTLLIRLLENEC